MSSAAPKTEGNKPSHYLYVVEGEGDDEFWTKIGAAWPHKDGKGFTQQFSAFPAHGARVVMRDAAEADAKAKQKAA